MLAELIHKLVEREDLLESEATQAMDALMSGRSTDAEIAAFLTALRMKGETAIELIGFARVMRERAEPFWDGAPSPVADTCGTGGDGSGTFNISTAAAFVAAGAGLHIAKHGNRSSSGCGSAGVMEALGVDIHMPVDRLRRAVTGVGIGFLFAPRFHSAMKYVMPVRAQLKMPTVFNILGPLANPARPEFQVVGVFSPRVMDLMAGALCGLGTRHAFVVHGTDGVDEISIAAPTRIIEIKNGEVRSSTVTPEDFGVTPVSAEAIRGGGGTANAAIIEGILRGQRGPRRDVVLMNAAAALLAGGPANSLMDGFRLAAFAIDSGAALKALQSLREMGK
jgi:anthranilate phosphoribosyltransferase